jgi:diguanylate cyclase (GGDEF)-like protein/PAS domain S-box-containing protein
MGSVSGQLDLANSMADLIPDLVCLCIGNAVRYINPAGCRMLGIPTSAPLLGHPLADVIHPDYRPIVEEGLEELVAEGSLPMMFVRDNGEPLELEVRVSCLPLQDAGIGFSLAAGESADQTVYMIHARDVGERMQAVQEILESEQRYRSLVNLALDFICLVDGQGRLSLLNAAAQDLLSVKEDDLLGKQLTDIVHPDYNEILSLGLDVLSEEDGLLPLKLLASDGEAVDVEARVKPLGRGDTYMVEARDIRARLRSAEAVREREQRLQGILDTVAEGIITADEMGIIQSFNNAAERIFGYRSRDVVGKNLSLLMPPPHDVQHDDYLAAHRARGGIGGILGQGRELEGLRKDGTRFPIELNVTELRLGRNRLFTGIIRDITDRKRAEEVERRYKEELELKVEERTRDLRRLSRQTQSILESAGDGIVGLDTSAEITFANPAAAQMLGWDQADMVGLCADEVFTFGDSTRKGRRVPVRAALRRGIYNERTEMVLMAKNGFIFDAEYASSPIEDDGDRTGAVVVFRNITERKVAEERLKVAGTVFETTAEGILVIDAAGHISMANAASAHITGWLSEQCLDRTVQEVLFPDNDPVFGEMTEALERRGACELEFWSTRRDGQEYAARLAASVVPDGDGNSQRIVVVVNDITQRKRDEERIRFQANYDMLTGLPNRTLFNDRLSSASAAARRAGSLMALMFIDLDGFKAVNDTLGHDAGDILLKGAAGRLRKCVRESDTVARLGGDEFTIIMSNVENADAAAQVAQRIIDSLTVPFDLSAEDGKAREGRISASIGIGLLPNHGDTAEDVLRNADAAMYHAKEQGKANYQFFRPELLKDH